MSENWETVGKAKKSKPSPDGKNQLKKNTAPALKVEDICTFSFVFKCLVNRLYIYINLFTVPKHQVQRLYSNVNGRKVNGSPDSGKKQKLSSKQTTAAPATVAAPKTKGVSIPHKPKPKNIEAGLAALNITELENVLESYKNSFTDSHLVWLKAVSY